MLHFIERKIQFYHLVVWIVLPWEARHTFGEYDCTSVGISCKI